MSVPMKIGKQSNGNVSPIKRSVEAQIEDRKSRLREKFIRQREALSPLCVNATGTSQRRPTEFVSPIEVANMRSTPVIALSILTGIALGAALVEALHAQGKPQAYVVGEISVTDPEGFAKEFSPLAR